MPNSSIREATVRAKVPGSRIASGEHSMSSKNIEWMLLLQGFWGNTVNSNSTVSPAEAEMPAWYKL
jgi:hypothetical protein